MLVWLLEQFDSVVHPHAAGDSRVYLTARIALAAILAFLAALVLGPLAIRWLRARFRERVVSASKTLDELHAAKSGTPTMGGLFVISAIIVATFLGGDLSNPYTLLSLFVLIGFAAIGAVDDWTKATAESSENSVAKTNKGMTARRKLAWQCAVAGVAAVWLHVIHDGVPAGHWFIWPFGDRGFYLGNLFAAWAAFVLVGASNGTNLTDGLDGLAGGCLVVAGAALTGLCYLSGHSELAAYLNIAYLPGSGELAVVLAAAVGAVLGFLWFNCHPAEVFMGDTGSLPLGALLGLASLAIRQEVLLVLVGGVFVVETLSVIFQVSWFRMTGARLIACSPLHNHFVFRGQAEHKIVVRFWIAAVLLAVAAFASLKVR